MTRKEALEVAKPILFNTEKVKAIQDGGKTVTRRVIKPCYRENEREFFTATIAGTLFLCYGDEEGEETRRVKVPYQVGDLLYVRETWAYRYCWECEQQGVADECELKSQKFKNAPFGECGCYKFRDEDDEPVDHQWHSASSMPKEAARIFLRVTGVRVEWLQDITITGLQEEGILNDGYISQYAAMTTTAFEDFKDLWDSTLKKSDIEKYGWDANPPVLVVMFERAEVSK